MVVFTCNHCGDSLQKPKVAKHYQTTCSRNPINLTCVDCFKDFNLEEYVVHTKCFTEDDRYSAKGTAQKILKGEIKQTEWMNTVNKIIEQQKDAKPSVKAVLEALVNYDNIPRKEAKFMNFMKSTFKFKFNMNDFKEVWKLLEAHKMAMKKSDEQKVENGLNGKVKQKQDQETTESNNQEKKSKKKKKKSESEDIAENGTNSVETSEDKSKKKKKSKQRDMENTNGVEETPEKKLYETNEENGIDTSSKKKKRKSTQETAEIPQENEIDTSSKKKKKRKSTLETVEIPQENEENGIDTSSKKKKKRKSTQETDESPQKKQKTEETSETNGVDSSSKKKTSECAETNDSKLDDSQNESFSFKQVIVDILTKKSKGLTSEVLQNKVFKKYEAIKGPIENKEILLKKYNKKLKALKNIALDNDKYKLISE